MIPASAGSLPNANPGSPSATTFTNSNCTAVNGAPQPNSMAITTMKISEILQLNKKLIALRIPWYTERPRATASTIVAKLSSVNTISAAPFATSVPVIPMAQPTSLAFNAGASLTPSPVIATTAPVRCQDLTIRILSSGVTRA